MADVRGVDQALFPNIRVAGTRMMLSGSLDDYAEYRGVERMNIDISGLYILH